MSARTSLYRLRDERGTLLYVGIAVNPGRGFGQHARSKSWWDEVSRIDLQHFATREEALLAEAVAKCGEGRVCRDSTKATISVYTGAVAGHRARLAELKPLPPPGVELRVAAALAFFKGGAPSDYMEAVGLFLPCLFGLLCELGMLGAAMFGFHPTGRKVVGNSGTVSDQSATVSEPVGDYDTQVAAVIRALRDQDGAICGDIGRAMQTEKSEASKRIADAERLGLVVKRADGKFKRVFLTDLGRSVAAH
jgi:hypothetical protein